MKTVIYNLKKRRHRSLPYSSTFLSTYVISYAADTYILFIFFAMKAENTATHERKYQTNSGQANPTIDTYTQAKSTEPAKGNDSRKYGSVTHRMENLLARINRLKTLVKLYAEYKNSVSQQDEDTESVCSSRTTTT